MRSIRVAVLVALTCGAVLLAQEAARMPMAEFKKLHAADKVLVVDVRDEGSFAGGHIPGAINIPLGTEDKRLNRLKTETRPIVTYCA